MPESFRNRFDTTDRSNTMIICNSLSSGFRALHGSFITLLWSSVIGLSDLRHVYNVVSIGIDASIRAI